MCGHQFPASPWPSFTSVRPSSDYSKTQVHRTGPDESFRGTKQHDWLRNGVSVVWVLHYGHDFSCGELQAWMDEELVGLSNMTTLFLLPPMKFSRGQVYWWATSNPRTTRNLAPGELMARAQPTFRFVATGFFFASSWPFLKKT